MANKTLLELFNEREAERNAALLNAAIDKEIEDLEFDIYLFRAALTLLDVENVEDIQVVNNRFIIIFKDDIGLHQLLDIETPEGVEVYGTDYGFRIVITDKCAERLDEHFRALINCVEAVIADRFSQIDQLVGKKTQ